MFSPQTVFVVGAGASCDFGFPTGDQLRDEISDVLRRFLKNPISLDDTFTLAVRSASQGPQLNVEFEEYRSAAKRLGAALPLAISIDNLLHAHRHDHRMIMLGKLAICSIILGKERASPLFAAEHLIRGSIQVAITDTSEVAASWHLSLMRLLGMGKGLEEVESLFDNVAFVVWNYDRCLEHFLANAIMNYFQVDSDKAVKAMRNLSILHPYGAAGRLPWQDGAGPIAKFGDQRPPLGEIAQSILTFTESADDGVRERTISLIQNAKTLVFMGFGFLPQNVELMTVQEWSNVERVFATTYGVGENDVNIIRSAVGKMIDRDAWYRGKPSLAGLGAASRPEFYFYPERGTCRDLMDNNWLRLTRG